MKYFLHDTSAFDDEKITQLFLSFGYEGLGLFYTFLEKIARQEKPIKTDVLKAQLKVRKRLEKCWEFMEEIGLISSQNGDSFSINLLNFSEKYEIKKEKTRKRVSEFRERQKDTENVTRYNRVSNASKVKESKVNESKSVVEAATQFRKDVFSDDNIKKYDKVMLEAFFNYWSEPNRTNTKLRYELQPTWKISGRLATWQSREIKGKKQGGGLTYPPINNNRIYREQ